MKSKNTLRYSLVPLLTATLLLIGCSKPRDQTPATAAGQPDDREVVARVDQVRLTRGEMNARARNFYIEETRRMVVPKGREEEAMESFRRRTVGLFVFKTIMLDEAHKRNIVVTDADRVTGTNRMAYTVKRQRGETLEKFFNDSPFGEEAAHREFEDGLLVDKLIEQEIAAKIAISEPEVEAAANKLMEDRKIQQQKLESIRARLLAGEDFAKVAAGESDCPSGKRSGGDLGQIIRGRSPAAFEQAVFTQPIGEIGPIIETSAGLHIVRVAARHAAQAATETTPAIPETAQVSHILLHTPPVATRAILMGQIRQAKLADAVKDFFAAARAQRHIETIYPDLAF